MLLDMGEPEIIAIALCFGFWFQLGQDARMGHTVSGHPGSYCECEEGYDAK